MHWRLLLLALAFAVVSARVLNKNAKFNPKRRMLHGRKYHGFVLRPQPSGKKVLAATETTIAQKIDHFDAGNTQTYEQRYWYSQQYHKSGGPVFLMIEGEAEASGGWMEYEDYPFHKMSKEHNAMMFVLEHRYYGKSQPFSDLSTEHMKYLSSRQALEDVADFIKAMNAKFNLNGAKWITFGGSYAGALSGWARLKYPDLVYGAVATSGPVQAEFDFTEYLDVVQRALTEQDATCGQNVHKAFTKLYSLMQTASGRSQVTRLFNPCYSFDQGDKYDLMMFYDELLGDYMGIVQYGGDNAGNYRDYLTVAKICSYHTTSDDPIQQLANFNQFMLDYYEEECTYNSFAGEIDCLKDTSTSSECGEYRAWIYQTCTEFGYYQTTSSKSGYFGDLTTVDMYVQQCLQAYSTAYTADAIQKAIDDTNAFYGGNKNYKGTRVVFPNGSWDPWSALGITVSNHPSYTAVYMKGTAHCANMYPPADDDLESLKTGRETIELEVATWVNSS